MSNEVLKAYRISLYGCVVAFALLSSKAGAIDAREFVKIGDIRQWISIKGTHDNDPVILFLHGGPGNSAARYIDAFTGEIRKKFIVVQWDQRETGETKKANSAHEALTVSLFEQDAISMINYLRTRFHKEKIYLMGHSWGGFLGLLVAARHPELLEGYFAISPMIWQEESERQTLQLMIEKARQDNNANELQELASVNIPFASGRDLFIHRKWLANLMVQPMVSQKFVTSWAATWLPVFREASAVNFFISAPEIRCPIYFLVGGHDYQTYYKLTEEYYGKVICARKKLYWFPESAHTFFSTGQKKLQEIVLEQLPERPN